MDTYVCVSVHMWVLLGTPRTHARGRIGAHAMARRRQRRVGDDEGAGLERFPPFDEERAGLERFPPFDEGAGPERFPPLFLHFAPTAALDCAAE